MMPGVRAGLLVLVAIVLTGFAWNDSRAAGGPEQTGGTVLAGQSGADAAAARPDASLGRASGDVAHPPDCRGLLEAVEQQRVLLVRETGRLSREIAALRQELTNPGIKDALAGIGYIFGIAGLALYFHSRKIMRSSSGN